MIVYKNIIQRLKDAGYTTYRLQKEKLLGQETISKLRHGESVSIRTINTVCAMLNCQPGEILEYRPDEAPEE